MDEWNLRLDENDEKKPGEQAPADGKGKKGKKEKKSLGQEILSWILTILAAVAIAIVIRGLVFEPVRVDGASMNDTLQNGAFMFVSKWDYNSNWLCLPWQDNAAKEAAPRIALGFGAPKRFDVVVCRYPGRGDTNFVKRIVGLPGDTLYIKDGCLYINGEKETGDYLRDYYPTLASWDDPMTEEDPVVLGEDEYFVMGDHRNNSNDSRNVGAISRDMIVGHVRFVFWPFDQFGGIN